MPNAIDIADLSFAYGRQPILEDISIRVPAGAIYGFIGPNGAGKTTTIKILLSLLKSFRGQVQLFDRDIRTQRIDILRRVGSLVEAPGLYPHLSGQENLRIRATLLREPARRVNDMLKIVGLTGARNKLVSQYSHGMKQRLGIGLALLADPELLILDEPTNGLDPSGIVEIRQLLQQLAAQGKTIFVSSHILSELEKIATDIGIIHQGRMRYQGSIEDLLRRYQSSVFWETSNPQICLTGLQQRGLSGIVSDGIVQTDGLSQEQIAGLNHWLVGQNVEVYAIRPHQPDLEDIFFDIINQPATL